jgi:hypothetical protein
MTSTATDNEIGNLVIASGLAPGLLSAQSAEVLDQELAISARTEIVFIEDNVADLDTLVQGMGAGKEVVILDSTLDGLGQIAAALEGRSGIDALHIISHGAAGTLNLGELTLNAASLNANSEVLQAIGSSLTAGGDILLYGCDTGAGSSGASFVEQLAIATGADVAASDDLTGSAALGGDWELEVTSGGIETAGVVDTPTAALYTNVLAITAPTTVGFDNFANIQSGGFSSASSPSNAVLTAATTDVIYNVNGLSNYQLRIDGATTAAVAYDGSPGQVFVGARQLEDSVTLSFVGGQLFTAGSISIDNWGAYDQYLIIKGYDANGLQVGSNVTKLLPVSEDYTTGTPIDLTLIGLTPIKTLKITATTEGGKIEYLMIDSISMSNIQKPPAVTSVTSSTATGSYNAGDQINITVNFDAAVDVTGTPQLKLETGTTDRVINYVSGTGGTSLIFTYTVQAGDTSADLDYFSTAALTLNGGTIKAAGTSTDATLSLPTPGTAGSLGANAAIVIDTTAPAAPGPLDLATANDLGTSSTDNITRSTTPQITGSGAEANSTIKLYDGASQIGSTTANGSGNWSLTPALSNGTHSLTATATDAAGNVSAASTPLSITIDTVAPTLSITSDKLALKGGETATITFTFSEDPGATFTLADVTVDHGSLSNLSTSGATRTATYTPATYINNGTITLSVAAGSYTDTAGNTPAAGSSLSIAVDTVAPWLAITSSKSTLKTGETATITFTFSEDPGSSFDSTDITVSGGTLGALSGSGLTRTATFTPTANTNNGTASITVQSGFYTDAAGNGGSAGATPSLTFDTLAPSAPSVPNLDTSTDSGASHADDLTRDTALVFTGSAENGATVTLYDSDGTTAIGHGTASGGTWTITTSTLSAGSHTITAKAVDALGNASAASGGLTVTIDTAPPAAPSMPDLVSDSGEDGSDNVTKVSAPTLRGTAEAGATVRLYDSDGTTLLGQVQADGSGVWEITASTLGDGVHALTVKATDAAGNTSAASASLSVTIDTTVPAAPSIPDLLAASDSGSSDTDNITGDTRPTFTGTAADGLTVKLFDGGIEIGSAAVDHGTWTITSTSALAAGTRYITVMAVDAAGNVASSSALVVQVVTSGPATSIASLHFSSDDGASNSDFVTSTAFQTISGTLSASLAAGERVQVSLNGGANWTTASAATGSSNWSLAPTLSEGTHDVSVRVIDAIDNPGPVLSQPYTLDTTVPDVTITSSASQLKAGETATITFTFSDDPGSSFSWDGSAGDVAVSGGTLSAISGTGVVRTATFTPLASTNASTASITVGSAAYNDLAGNANTSIRFVSLAVDTLAPSTPSAPALLWDTGRSDSDNVIGTAYATLVGDVETAGTVTLYDADSGTVLSSTSTSDGKWALMILGLAEGQHRVYVVARDVAGNLSAPSAATTFTVDTVDPTVTISSDVAQVSAGETATITFTFSDDPGADFGLDDISVTSGTLSNLSGSGLVRTATFTPDPNNNGMSASILVNSFTDAAGNASTAVFYLPVDTQAPTASAPVLAVGSDTGSSSTDKITNTATPSFTGTPETGSTVTLYDTDGTVLGTATATHGFYMITTGALADGSHTITARLTDAAGNVGPLSEGVTIVVDTQVAAPAAPRLDPASDDGAAGDGITTDTTPTFSGTAEPLALVTLYDTDGITVLGSAQAGADGAWSITTGELAGGAHAVTARQTDRAGNVSAPGAALKLHIGSLVDGVAVVTQPVLLPGGVAGTSISIPVVTSARAESAGQSGVADIPLLSSGGVDLLLAQLAPGYGLSASGANLSAANAGDTLIAAILAATPGHDLGDQGHLTANGQSFLAGLASSGSLLVETVTPVSSAPDGVLTLSGPGALAGQGVALVIEAGGLAAGSTIVLQDVDFAAVIGAANVVAGSGSSVLTGDAASQHFTVQAGATTEVYAGAGNDTLSFVAPASGAAAAASVAVLQGGEDNDVVVFSGVSTDFNVEYHNGYVLVSSKAAPQAKALVVNVERLAFSDIVVTVQNNSDLLIVAGLYETVLGRQADLGGFEFWSDVHQAGASWGRIALDMLNSSESTAANGAINGDAAHDVGLLYQVLFNRAADAGGLAYWTDLMSHGMSLETVADSLVQSAEMVGHQRAALDWNFYV